MEPLKTLNTRKACDAKREGNGGGAQKIKQVLADGSGDPNTAANGVTAPSRKRATTR